MLASMHPNSTELLRRILRSVALGVPLALGPLALGSGCSTQCSPGRSMTSVHAVTPAIEAVLGTGASFSAANCATLCRALDFPIDAGGADAGPSMIDPDFASRAVTVTCRYATSVSLECEYRWPELCSTSGLCFTSTPGRAPQALVRAPASAPGGVAGWLAEAASLEAASVPAFEELAMELELHGAPAVLVRAARHAADDERRHARAVGWLARAYGAEPARFRRGEHAPRSLAELAADNAAEGCVREALGALAAVHQGAGAADVRAGATFRTIAREEAGHALLSLAIDEWARPRLRRAERRFTDEARQGALARARLEASQEPSVAQRVLLGVPDATRSSALAALADRAA